MRRPRPIPIGPEDPAAQTTAYVTRSGVATSPIARIAEGDLIFERWLVAERGLDTDATSVYRGTDLRDSRAVTIEVLRADVQREAIAALAGELELRAALSLRHPNVLAPIDVGRLADGTPFVVTPRFDGAPLSDRVCLSGKLTIEDFHRIAADVCAALAAAHAAGILHGALHPDHVFLAEQHGVLSRALVSGFGSSILERDTDLGFSGRAFVAPEHVVERPTIAADVFAAGALLYFAVTGAAPYTAPRASDSGLLGPRVPAELLRVLVHAQNADPAERYGSADEMRRAIDAALGGAPPAVAEELPRFTDEEAATVKRSIP